MLYRQDLDMVRVDGTLRSGHINFCRGGHNHVLLHLGVDQAEPALSVRLNDNCDLPLLPLRPSAAAVGPGLRLADANGHLSSTTLQEVVQIAGSLGFLWRGEGAPAIALAGTALAVFSRELDALDGPAMFQRSLNSLLLNIGWQPAKEDGVRHRRRTVVLRHSFGVPLHAARFLRLRHHLEWAGRCVRRPLLQRCLRHGGGRA
mmetsp:Transcript_86144/g.155161  ORF Transcript_86144/g.155161 Transcript_86144/m.155161 type:complete len:203 (+) Transcript_86144:447-1055(+)